MRETLETRTQTGCVLVLGSVPTIDSCMFTNIWPIVKSKQNYQNILRLFINLLLYISFNFFFSDVSESNVSLDFYTKRIYSMTYNEISKRTFLFLTRF